MRKILVLLVFATLAVALAVAGCMDKAKVGSGGGAGNVSGDEVMTKAFDAFKSVNSAAYTGDIELKVTIDQSKTSPDPQTAALAKGPITIHLEGALDREQETSTATVKVSAAGQTIEGGLTSTKDGVWVQLMGQWYQAPADQVANLRKFTQQTPDEMLKTLGMDPQSWATERTVVGTEQIDGAECYHVVVKDDPKKIAESLVNGLNSLQSQGVGTGQTGEQIGAQLQSQSAELATMLGDVGAEYWIDVKQGYVRKGVLTAKINPTSTMQSQGVQSADVKITFGFSKFNEPVNVTPPATSLPWDQLGQGLFGGGLGGATPQPSDTIQY